MIQAVGIDLSLKFNNKTISLKKYKTKLLEMSHKEYKTSFFSGIHKVYNMFELIVLY